MAMYPIHKNGYKIMLTGNGAKLLWDNDKPEINDELIKLLDSGKRIITQQDIPDDQLPHHKLLRAGDTVTKDFILNKLLGNINNRYVDLEDYDEVLKRIENGETVYKPDMNYMGSLRDPGPGYAKTNIPTVSMEQLRDGYMLSHGDDSDDEDDGYKYSRDNSYWGEDEDDDLDTRKDDPDDLDYQRDIDESFTNWDDEGTDEESHSIWDDPYWDQDNINDALSDLR